MHDPTVKPAKRIYLSAPHVTHLEREALMTAFDSNWIAPTGPALNEFEARLRSITGAEGAVAVSSGTAALHLALLILDIGPGDIVLCPSVTFVASANVIRYVGATPHFVDCDPSTGNIDADCLVRALGDLNTAGYRPSALIAVDLYGTCADYTTIEHICDGFDVPIIEDAAEAIGATHNGRPAGSFGTLGAFSFNGNKLVTTGGGGALVGPAELIAKATYLAGQARQPVRHFEHHELGYAYRMSNLSAAIGVGQLTRLDAMIDRTRTIHRRYVRELGQIEGVSFASQAGGGAGNGWLTVAHLDQSLHPSPNRVCDALAEHNIEARPAWKPMHQQPLYASVPMTGGAGADQHFETGICLPSGSSMDYSDQTRVIAAFRSALSADASIDLSGIDLGAASSTDAIDVTDARSRQHQGNPASTS